ncbi:ankyrin repeat-containing domain protein [Pavlovales sp. CCMP2436]|nr:ankyrin repeat-containing domain protein [Pavlovales sp. CCMP2436]
MLNSIASDQKRTTSMGAQLAATSISVLAELTKQSKIDADSARTATELLKAGINIDYQDLHGKTAAHFAAEYGHSKMLGTNMHLTTNDRWTVLHEAVSKGDKASIDMLLHMYDGPDINARDASARTALLIAAYRCDEEILVALIVNGADPSITDCLRMTFPRKYSTQQVTTWK